MANLRLDPHLLRIHPDAFVADNVTLIGDVSLDAGVSVWFTAVIRGDEEAIRVGRNSNVQDGAILHADPGFPCVIGEGVTIGHRAVVHGATLEDSVVVGMGATILNGAVIGAGSIVGAGAVVSENTVVPPGSLVLGVPARVRREVSPAERATQAAAADYYVANAKEYREAGHGRSWARVANALAEEACVLPPSLGPSPLAALPRA